MTLARMIEVLGAPAWVRRCAGMNHRISYELSASFEKCVERWFCRTCGKDRP